MQGRKMWDQIGACTGHVGNLSSLSTNHQHPVTKRNINKWSGRILSSSTNGLSTEGAILRLHHLPDARTGKSSNKIVRDFFKSSCSGANK